MRKIKTLTILILLIISKLAYSQATIDFSTITYNPNFFDNSGCPTYHRFGPNPVSVNGYNIRTVGSTLYTWNLPKSLSLYAFGNTTTGQRTNAIVAVEYPFLANKTYQIEINGLNDHSWDGTGMSRTIYNGVFWLKLENNTQISTNVQNPCDDSYTTIERSVGRYSKLIADPSIAFENKAYTVKFSPIENKNSLKIIFDSSPSVPDIIIDNIFRLRSIKITEMPYEEDLTRRPSYTNVDRPDNLNPSYHIEYTPTNDRPPRTGGVYIEPIYKEVQITPDKWILNESGTTMSVSLSTLSVDYVFELQQLNLIGDWVGTPGTREGVYRQRLPLPTSFHNNTYSYQIINGEVFIILNSNVVPNENLDFSIQYID